MGRKLPNGHVVLHRQMGQQLRYWTLIVKPCAAAISCTANAHGETFAVNQVPDITIY
jgi:hypothetical protein